MSVGDLASKYGRPTSPGGLRSHPSIDTQARQAEPTTYRERESASAAGYRSTGVREGPPASPSAPTAPAGDDFAARRRQQQRTEQMAELELRDKERELRRREQDIEQRARELENERAQLMVNANASLVAESSNNTTATRKPRERQLSFQQDKLRRPLSGGNLQPESPPVSSLNRPISPQPARGALRPHSQYSASATHLVPPSASSKPSYQGINEDGEYRRHQQQSGSQCHEHDIDISLCFYFAGDVLCATNTREEGVDATAVYAYRCR
ncbi:hypothetical protein MPER_06561 [Moniliophthora perniciosa FA553]|nr:hypothetical protein MPER_06561 [Moniliophthora perniciosa FA553]